MTTFFSTASFTPAPLASASSNLSPSVSTSSFSVSMSSHFSATSPNASTNQTQCIIDDTALRLPLAVIYSLIFVFGLVGNLFALWVFLFLNSSRNSVRVFLINCAVADLVLLTCLPFRVFYHINGNKWTLGTVACKFVGNLFYMNMYVSITLLGLISLDRFLRLRGKGRAQRGMRMRLWGHSRPWSWMACGALWALSLVAIVPMIATPEDTENSGKCFHYKQRHSARKKAYFNAVLVLLFWLVFTILVVSYARIASRLLRVSRDKPDLPNAHKYERTAKKSFFVLFLFTLCFGPYHAFRPIYIYSQLDGVSCDYLHLVDRTNEVMLLFSAFNSCLDPIMYFLLSGSVRKAALQALGHRLGNRFPFLIEATSLSSTAETRRPSMPMALPNSALNTPSLTPRTSICVMNSNLRRTGATILPLSGQR
ncbi:putative G-protein coupled receptor 34a [Odontesthes bonariensis]|uniref:putative G-protein coupled receptor 34a n=1 Tax=Odontesthes bonariensis TaxID=219752 RepID=UPI003F580540